MPKDVVPIAKDYGRIPEQGRIRLGVKTERAMKALDTFRFTSPDPEAIAALASLYGGKAKPWSDKRASPKEQWEVITEADSIKVWGTRSGLVEGCSAVVMALRLKSK